MTAYAIGYFTVWDESWSEGDYGSEVAKLVKKHGGRYLAFAGDTEALEGNPTLPDALVVIEFPDMAAARAWYSDPDYQPFIERRNTGSKADILLVDGAF